LHRVACLALVACASSDDTIDRTFDPCALAITATGDATQMAGITDALALWGITPGEGEPLEVRFEEAAPAFHGFYDDERGIVLVNQRITDPKALAVVIAHELGHAFGLPHIDDRASLMNRGNLAITPTDDDRALVTARWGSCAGPPRSSRLR
jgi:hypothetical protein